MGSIWTQHCEIKERPPLQGDLNTEVAVIGAGMAGVLTAHALQNAGKRVVVLEADRIAGGQTRNTTAKITSQHGMIYGKLARTLGEEKARQYAMANEAAVEAYRRLVAAGGIDCDFEERDAWVCGDDREQLEAEAEAAARLGLPASFRGELSLPIPVSCGVRFRHQAQFHPLKFLRALSEELTVYAHTPVRTVEGTAVMTDRGTVQAEQVVFACHFPFLNVPGMYFARMHQERSYVLALEHAPKVEGMFISAEKNGVSLRTYQRFLLLGGEGHRTGEGQDGGHYEVLRQRARLWFPGSREVAHWSAQDCVTPDSVPYIGRFAAGKPEWYVATGFQKWGMTGTMVSAMVLRELLRGRNHPCAGVFDPGRFGVQMAVGIAGETGQAVKGLAKRFFQVPGETAEELPIGHGGIVFYQGKKLGVYRDGQGQLYAVDLRCPHLGCQLEWNPDERSWDCPCHGSRFDYKGRLLSGPAQTDLSRE